MIAVILLIITTLASMYHEQIVTWLTPFTEWVHECVLSLVYCNAVTMTRLQFGVRVARPDCRSVCDILSSCNVLFYCPSNHRSLVHFASAIWSRSRLRSLWTGMGLMGRVCNRCYGHFPRRGWQFLVRSYNSGLYSAC